MKIKQPEEFGSDDTETITVRTVKGIYNGPGTLHERPVKAEAGPIHQVFDKFQRLVSVLPNQDCGGFERQWLYAVWQSEISEWTVDHPNC